MARNFTTADGLVPIDLLQSSVDHLKAAQKLFDSSASFFDSAGYLVHLAIELMLKAWLLQCAGQFEALHLLRELHALLVREHGAQILSAEESNTLTLLDRYSDLRYPNRDDPVEVGNQSLQGIDNLFDAIFNQLPQELLDAFAALNPLEKGGRVLMKRKIDRTST
jgi:HEPN domain-containing protein